MVKELYLTPLLPPLFVKGEGDKGVRSIKDSDAAIFARKMGLMIEYYGKEEHICHKMK